MWWDLQSLINKSETFLYDFCLSIIFPIVQASYFYIRDSNFAFFFPFSLLIKYLAIIVYDIFLIPWEPPLHWITWQTSIFYAIKKFLEQRIKFSNFYWVFSWYILSISQHFWEKNRQSIIISFNSHYKRDGSNQASVVIDWNW